MERESARYWWLAKNKLVQHRFELTRNGLPFKPGVGSWYLIYIAEGYEQPIDLGLFIDSAMMKEEFACELQKKSLPISKPSRTNSMLSAIFRLFSDR